MRLLEILGMAVVLAGCTAQITTPVTAPIWLIIGVVCLMRPAIGPIWRGCTGLHILPLLSIGLFGLVSWLDLLLRFGADVTNSTAIQTFTMFVIGMGLAGFTFVAWWYSRSTSDGRAYPSWCVSLQIIVAMIATVYTVTFLAQA
jgi:hypothetical protein